MRMTWSRKVDLEPQTGNEAVENNVVEQKLGVGKIGTWVVLLLPSWQSD